MFIQERFSNGVNPFTPQVDYHESTTAISHDKTTAGVGIPGETLSSAVLYKQSDGSLRWMTLNRFGSLEYRTFKNEELLNNHLSQNEMVDIWEIEDRRTGNSQTIYKCCDSDTNLTFDSKEELYREIASTMDHGIFLIHDLKTNEERYIQQKRGWFQYGFEEVSLEQAQKTILTRETAREQRCKNYAIGIATLAAAPVLVGIVKTLSKSLQELTTVSLTSSYPLVHTLQKTTTIFSAALLTYGMSGISAGPGKSLPKALPVVILGVLSWSKPAEAQLCPVLAGSYDTSGYAYGVAVSGSYAYVAYGDYGLQIIDVNNTTNPVRVGWYNTPGSASGVAVYDSYAYVADGRSGLQIIDVSNVANPVRVGWSPGSAFGIAVSDSYAYVANRNSGLGIIDVNNATNPVSVGWYNTPGNARGVVVSGSYAYVADTSSGLQIIDISNVANPVSVGWYNTTDRALGIDVSGNYAYVADGTSGLQIIDVSNVANPTLAGSIDTPGLAIGVAVSGNYAYVADEGSGLQIINVSNVANPMRVGWYNTPDRAYGVAVSGSYAYVADGNSGLQIIDISCFLGSSTTSTNQLNSSILTNSTMSSTVLSNTLLHTSSKITTLPLPTDSSSNNTRSLRIGLGVGIAVVVCLGATGITWFYLLKKRKESADLETNAWEDNISSGSATHKSFKLSPIVKKRHKEIGEEYYQLSTIDKKEVEGIYQQTGHLIVFPEGAKKIKHVIGKGHFGAIKVAQRIEDGQYVVSKKVKGYENIKASEAEANLQKDAAGENILPIFNTIKLENALYHFMPLAGLGDGSVIQQQLAMLSHSKLATEILTHVFKDLLTGLNTLHGKGIYHLDIKPDNLVFTKDGTGYITDFGCARASATPQIPSNAIGDTRYYSPERLQARRVSTTFDGEKADLWAAGVALLQIIKNMDPHQLFEMPGQFALRVQSCTPAFFQERLKSIKELQYPEANSIWWVIKGLLDPHSATRYTAREALEASCFKGLDKTHQASVFEDLKREEIAQNTTAKKEEVDLSHYGGIAQALMKREMPAIYESEQHQHHYHMEGYGPVPTAVTGAEHYQAPPENPTASDF